MRQNMFEGIVDNLNMLPWNQGIYYEVQTKMFDFPQCPKLTNAKLLTSFITSGGLARPHNL